MPAKRSNASTLLQKVNSQLRGERIPLKAKDEDELATYLDNLKLKSQPTKIVNFEKYGEISISSEADTKNSTSVGGCRSSSPAFSNHVPANRFLKKKPISDVTGSQNFGVEKAAVRGKNEKKATITSDKKTKRHASSSDNVNALTKPGQASGLRRFVSKDSDSDASITGPNVGERSGSVDADVGRDGLKFVKNQKTLVEDEESRQIKRNPSQCKHSEQRDAAKHTDEILRTLGQQFVSSDQDSLAEFIQGLSSSESSAKRPQNLITKKQQKWLKRTSSSASHSPSPVLGSRSPSPVKHSKSPYGKLSRSVSQDTDMADLIDSEIIEDRRGSVNSDDFKINLVDVTSLLPSSSSAPPRNKKFSQKRSKNDIKKPEKSSNSNVLADQVTNSNVTGKKIKSQIRNSSRKSESLSSLFENLGIHMADELLNSHIGNSRNADLDISEESEIKTESSGKQRKTMQRQHSQSQKGIPISDTQRKTSLFERESAETSDSEMSPIEESIDRKENHDLDVTDIEYSESFDSESQTITQNVSQKFRDKTLRSRSQRSQKSTHRNREHKVVMEEVLLDVSAADKNGGRHHWNTTHMDIHVSTPYGLQYVDPAPIATHVVSADALEALTAYSPNMFALQEMMKAQLQLVHNFVDIQRRIYQSCLDGLNYDYKYTTLEDTKAYINKHQKPYMTFKDALELVEQEGITA